MRKAEGFLINGARGFHLRLKGGFDLTIVIGGLTEARGAQA